MNSSPKETQPGIPLEALLEQTRSIRQRMVALLRSIPSEQVDTVPPGWKNNARWHAGHLVVTPRLLTYALVGEPLGIPPEYRKWFAKETTPQAWQDKDALPSYGQLIDELIPGIEQIFADFARRLSSPFAQPYTTSAGTVLRTPAEALNFSLVHDGIHIGMLLALKRDLALCQNKQG